MGLITRLLQLGFTGQRERRVGFTRIPDIVRYTVDSLRIGLEAQAARSGFKSEPDKIGELIAELEKARGVKYGITWAEDVTEAKEKQESTMKISRRR